MMILRTRTAILLAMLTVASCGSDDKGGAQLGDGDGDGHASDDGSQDGAGDGAGDGQGDGGDGTPAADAGPDGMDASTDAGQGDAGYAVSITVPALGGTLEYASPSGLNVSFEFPASAAGQTIEIAPTSVAPQGFAASDFAELIELKPDGLVFADPVRVMLGSRALMALNFASGVQVPDPLALSADSQALLLTHFSTLALIDPNTSCESSSGWVDEPNSGRCAPDSATTTYRRFGCKNYRFCHVIEAGCCVDANDPTPGCSVGAPNVSLTYTRTGSNGGEYTYCDDPVPDAGAPACVVPGVDGAPGICRETQGGCECVMDYDDGAGYDTYVMTCTGATCECRLNGTLAADRSSTGVCDSQPAMQAAYAATCCPSF